MTLIWHRAAGRGRQRITYRAVGGCRIFNSSRKIAVRAANALRKQLLSADNTVVWCMGSVAGGSAAAK